MLAVPATDDARRLRHGFELCVARCPTAAETEVLLRTLHTQRSRFAADAVAASVLVAVGDLPAPHLPPAELAAWTMVASVLLNKSETITRP